MSALPESYSEAFAKLAELASKRGIVAAQNELTEIAVDDVWLIKLNGTDATIDRIPPIHAMVWANGWPVGLIYPFDGTMMVDAEDDLIAALDAAIAGDPA